MSDLEASQDESSRVSKVSHFRLLLNQTLVTDEVLNHPYTGEGTHEAPYAIEWIPGDPKNPYNMPTKWKWIITIIMAFSTLAISFSSSAFSGAIPQVTQDLNISSELAIATVSMFVLGFALGPMSWAPMSELYGRQYVFIGCFVLCTIVAGASIASQNIATLLVLRFLAGVFGSSSIVNSAAVISDIFVAKERGLAVMVYTSAPFLGPTLGPICGGFLAQYEGWRWVNAMTVIFTGVILVLGTLLVPETYTPVMLAKRAALMSKMTGKVYKSKLELDQPRKTPAELLKITLTRPWIILFFEPIVLLLSIYSAIIYGTLYMIFTAYPIVFQGQRHWTQGNAGLPYFGIMAGQVFAMFFYIFLELAYRKRIAKNPALATPEGRLDPALIGGVLLPIGLFWFAWTTANSIHYMVSILGGTIFGFGQVLLFISLINYVIDSYTVFAASALAANAILRALFGAAFPLFTRDMYKNLGVHWASTIPAFLALACAPMPFLFYKWGYAIRMRSKYAGEAARIMASIMKQGQGPSSIEDKAVVEDDEPTSSLGKAEMRSPVSTTDAEK